MAGDTCFLSFPPRHGTRPGLPTSAAPTTDDLLDGTPLCVSARSSPPSEANQTPLTYPSSHNAAVSALMSRQERRKVERDAAKRAPANTEAGGAGGAAAALAHLRVNPLGDWPTQATDPYVGPGGFCHCSPRHRIYLTRQRKCSSVSDFPAGCVVRIAGALWCVVVSQVFICGI